MFNFKKKPAVNVSHVDLTAIPSAKALFENSPFKPFWQKRGQKLKTISTRIPFFRDPLTLDYQNLRARVITYTGMRYLLFISMYIMAIFIQAYLTYDASIVNELITNKSLRQQAIIVNFLHQSAFMLFTGFLLLTITYLLLRLLVLKHTPKILLTIGWWLFSIGVGISELIDSTVVQYINSLHLYGKHSLVLPNNEIQLIVYFMFMVIMYYIFKHKQRIYRELTKIYITHGTTEK